jgi:hypothetical protein
MALDVAEVLATVEPRIKRLLDRRGLGDGDDDVAAPDTWTDEAPVLAGLAAASVHGTVALGPHPGARLHRLGDPIEEGEAPAQGGCHARANGYDLHAVDVNTLAVGQQPYLTCQLVLLAARARLECDRSQQLQIRQSPELHPLRRRFRVFLIRLLRIGQIEGSRLARVKAVGQEMPRRGHHVFGVMRVRSGVAGRERCDNGAIRGGRRVGVDYAKEVAGFVVLVTSPDEKIDLRILRRHRSRVATDDETQSDDRKRYPQ